LDVWGNWRLNFLSREGREGGEVRRTGIIVEPHRINSKAPSGATSSEYAALKIILVLGSTNMPRLTALGTARRRKRQPGRSRSPLRTGRALRNSQFAIRNGQGFFSGSHFGMDDWGIWPVEFLTTDGR
jgi:hypothetical protein